jgi:hypothetical protein
MNRFRLSSARPRPGNIMQAVRRGLLVVFAMAVFAVLAAGAASAASENNLPQRAVLYEEDTSNSYGRKYDGSVLWRTVPIKTEGQPEEFAVTADIEIPERKLRMTMTLRRNTDKSLPASHVVELRFALSPDFVGGGIGNVPGLLLKTSAQARGTPLAALAVKVTDGFFMVGLSNEPADRAKNLALILERVWFDIPIVYSNNHRAILAIEKGSSGANALRSAFGAANQAPATAYFVQVSAQRSEEDAQASYRVLQGKFPDLLGSRELVVKRADTDSGASYRATVGPFATADEAFDLCESLKAAGGQCVVQRN